MGRVFEDLKMALRIIFFKAMLLILRVLDISMV